MQQTSVLICHGERWGEVMPMQFFCNEVSAAWSADGRTFPMLAQSGEIFLVGFNSQRAILCAYGVITVADFRTRLLRIAEQKMTEKILSAMAQASRESAPLYATLAEIDRIKKNE